MTNLPNSSLNFALNEEELEEVEGQILSSLSIRAKRIYELWTLGQYLPNRRGDRLYGAISYRVSHVFYWRRFREFLSSKKNFISLIEYESLYALSISDYKSCLHHPIHLEFLGYISSLSECQTILDS